MYCFYKFIHGHSENKIQVEGGGGGETKKLSMQARYYYTNCYRTVQIRDEILYHLKLTYINRKSLKWFYKIL